MIVRNSKGQIWWGIQDTDETEGRIRRKGAKRWGHKEVSLDRTWKNKIVVWWNKEGTGESSSGKEGIVEWDLTSQFVNTR